MKSMTIDLIENEQIQNIQDTEDSSNSHSHDLLDDEKEGNQTVSEILSLLSSTEAKSHKEETSPAALAHQYQRSKVLQAPKACQVPIF